MTFQSELDDIYTKYGPRLTDLTAQSVAWMRLNDSRYCDIPTKSLLGDQWVQAKQDILDNPKIRSASADLVRQGLERVNDIVKSKNGTEDEMHTNLIKLHRSCVVAPHGGLQIAVDTQYTNAWSQSIDNGTSIPTDSEIRCKADTTYKGWEASAQVPTIQFSDCDIRESLLRGEDSCVDAVADKLSRKVDASDQSQLKSYLKAQIWSFQSQRWANDLGGQGTPNQLRFEPIDSIATDPIRQTMQFSSADGYLDGLVLPEPLNLEDLSMYFKDATSTMESIL